MLPFLWRANSCLHVYLILKSIIFNDPPLFVQVSWDMCFLAFPLNLRVKNIWMLSDFTSLISNELKSET